MGTNDFIGTEAIRFGWKTTRENLRPLLTIGVAAAMLFLFDAALGRANDALSGFARLVVQLLQVALAMAWTRAALKLHDGQRLEAPLVKGQLEGYLGYLVTWVLYALIVTLGLLLLIVPGILWAIEYAFAGYFVVDQRLDPVAALRASRRLTRGVKGELFGFALLLFGLNLLGALALGIGLAITIPCSYLAGAWVFRRLQARAAEHGPAWTMPAPQAM